MEQLRAIGSEDEPPPLPDGVDVVVLSDQPELWAACYERFGREVLADFAVFSPLEISAEQWTTSWAGDPMFLAVHGGEVIGCAGLHLDTDQPDRAENGLTAVRRDASVPARQQGPSAALAARRGCGSGRHAVRAVPVVAAVGRAGVPPESGGLGAVVSSAEGRRGCRVGFGRVGRRVGRGWCGRGRRTLASMVQRGKMQWPSRSMTSSRIQVGGSWTSTASPRCMLRTGWMTTWWWPTQSRILVRVAAPSFSISPTASAEPPVASTSRSSASTRT